MNGASIDLGYETGLAVAGQATPRFSNSYNAAKDSRNRRSISPTRKTEDWLLDKMGRAKLTANGRDLRRNFSDAAWAIRKHLDFVSTFRFQARTGNTLLDDRVEKLISLRSMAQNCDLAGRHTLSRMIRLMEAHAVVDGDVFWLKLADGRIQGIEGERVRDPEGFSGPLPLGYKLEDFTHGIACSPGGRAMDYAVHNRTKQGYVFHRLFPARWVISHGYYDRYDQVRGVTPLSASLNDWRDIAEGRVYALGKSKVAQFFGLAIYRDAAEQLGSISPDDEDDERDYGKEIDFKAGPQILDLDPGDKAEFLENHTPSTEFQQFDQAILASALKSLDIPFSFYNESFTNFFGSKGALQQYLYSAQIKRAALQGVLDQWTQWQLGMAVGRGELMLPAGVGFESLNWQWIPAGLPWWKPLEEVKAFGEAISLSLNSTPRACLDRGEDAYEILAEEAEFQIARAEATKRVHDAGGRMPWEEAPAPEEPPNEALKKEMNGEKANV